MKFKNGHVQCNIKQKKKWEKRHVASPNSRFRHCKGEPNNSLSNASDEHYGRVNLQPT